MTIQDFLNTFFEQYNQKFIDAVNMRNGNFEKFIDFFSLSIELYCDRRPAEKLSFQQQIYYHRKIIEEREMAINGLFFMDRELTGGHIVIRSLEALEAEARSVGYEEMEKILTQKELGLPAQSLYLISCKEHYRSSAYDMLLNILYDNSPSNLNSCIDFKDFKSILKTMSDYYADQCVGYKPIKNIILKLFNDNYY